MIAKGSILHRQHSHQLDEEPIHLLPRSAGTHACYRSDNAVSSGTANRVLLLELCCLKSLRKRLLAPAPYPDIPLGNSSSEASYRKKVPSKRTRLSRQNGLPRLPQHCHRLIPAKATSCFNLRVTPCRHSCLAHAFRQAGRNPPFLLPSTSDTPMSFSFSWSKPRSSPRMKTTSSIVSRISFSRSPPHTRYFRRHLSERIRRICAAKMPSPWPGSWVVTHSLESTHGIKL